MCLFSTIWPLPKPYAHYLSAPSNILTSEYFAQWSNVICHLILIFISQDLKVNEKHQFTAVHASLLFGKNKIKQISVGQCSSFPQQLFTLVTQRTLIFATLLRSFPIPLKTKAQIPRSLTSSLNFFHPFPPTVSIVSTCFVNHITPSLQPLFSPQWF